MKGAYEGWAAMDIFFAEVHPADWIRRCARRLLEIPPPNVGRGTRMSSPRPSAFSPLPVLQKYSQSLRSRKGRHQLDLEEVPLDARPQAAFLSDRSEWMIS